MEHGNLIPSSHISLSLVGRNTLDVHVRTQGPNDHDPVYKRVASGISLDHQLGNREGSFDIGGVHFSRSARNIRVVGSTILAELRSSAGAWLDDRLGVDVEFKPAEEAYSVTLVSYGDRHKVQGGHHTDDGLGPSVYYSIENAQLPDTGTRWAVHDLWLDYGNLLSTSLRDGHGGLRTSTINLDELLGNSDGMFSSHGHSFSQSASGISLDGVVLRASLKRVDGSFVNREISVSQVVRIVGGQVVPIDHEQRVRQGWQPLVLTWIENGALNAGFRTCRGMALSDKSIITAECRDDDGRWRRSIFDLNDVLDIYPGLQGQARFRVYGRGSSGFKNRVSQVDLRDGVLYARFDGTKSVSKDLRGVIDNHNGVLALTHGLSCDACRDLFRGGVLLYPLSSSYPTTRVELDSFGQDVNPTCGVCNMCRGLASKLSVDLTDITFRIELIRRGADMRTSPMGYTVGLDLELKTREVSHRYRLLHDRTFDTHGAPPPAFEYLEERAKNNVLLDNEQRFQHVSKILDECSSRHEKCRRSGVQNLPFRILSVGDHLSPSIRVVENSQVSFKYACLSHRWAGQQPLMLTRETFDRMTTGFQMEDLPLTYRDAITYCRKLGLQYVWIDSLCILQDSQDDWIQESAKMADYYGNCELCFAATSAGGPYAGLAFTDHEALCYSPGIDPAGIPYRLVAVQQDEEFKFSHFGSVSTNPELSDDFPLLERAWVYQERWLAPRILHCCANEFTLKCSERVWCECGKGWREDRDDGLYPHWGFNPYDLDTKDQGRFLSRNKTRNANWMRHVVAYSALALTYKEDRLPALSGLARRFEMGTSRAYPLGRYLAGMWERDLPNQLVWFVGRAFRKYAVWTDGQLPLLSDEEREGRYPGAVAVKPSDYQAPSWSWASVSERVMHRMVSHQRQVLCEVLEAETVLSTSNPLGPVSEGCFLRIRGGLLKTRWEIRPQQDKAPMRYQLVDMVGAQNSFQDNGKSLEFLPDYVLYKAGPHCIDPTVPLYVFLVLSEGIPSIPDWLKDEAKKQSVQRMRFKMCLILCRHKEQWKDGSDVYKRVGYLEYSSRVANTVNDDPNVYSDEEFIMI